MILGSGHHSKQRPPSPLSRGEDKRRTQEDKWKSGNSDKMLRDRSRVFDDTHDTSLNKHSLSSRLSKSSHAPSSDYVRLKNPPEPPTTESLVSKKKLKDKTVDKVK